MMYPIHSIQNNRKSLNSSTVIRSRTSVLLVLCLACEAAAWEGLTDRVDLQCAQQGAHAVHCEYRLIRGESASNITAEAGGKTLELKSIERYPWPGARSAVLFLIDTSDPGRQPVIDSNIKQIGMLAKAARSHHNLGLASFDKELRTESPFATAPDKIAATAQTLQAAGMTTELYRSLLQAIDMLERVQADRRAVILFSDGQAEDRAYFHTDVVRAARKAGVNIYSLGFRRSVALSVALQTLRRLSEETGGLYFEADSQLNLPPDFAGRIFSAVDGGGRFSVLLTPSLSEAPGSGELRIIFATGLDKISVDVSLSSPAAGAPAARQVVQPAVSSPSASIPEVRVVTSPLPRSRIDQWLWYGVPLALIVLIVLTVVTLVIISRKPARRPGSAVLTPVEHKALAYLVTQDEKATRFPITRTIWRIGRSHDNELVLDDSSVSRRHAEIQRAENGTFTLYDRHSLNGVFVNTGKVEKTRLSEGDIIEIGDIVMRFTESPADDHLTEQTSIQHTRQPRIS